VDDLGQRLMALLAGEKPEPPKTRVIAKVDPAVLAKYVGQYELDVGLGSASTMTVSEEHGRLWVQLALQPRLGIYPESETAFFYKGVDAQIEFVKDDAGEIKELLLHQNGRDFTAPKIKPQ
jgi:hypothetical protein